MDLTKISRAVDSVWHQAAATPGQKLPLPGGSDEEFEKWLTDHALSTGQHPEHRSDDIPDYREPSVDEAGWGTDESRSLGTRHTLDRELLSRRQQALCPECAYFHEYGEGSEEHEPYYDAGIRALADSGVHPHNLTNNSGENGADVHSGDCLLCGKELSEEDPGYEYHLFQPGDRGHYQG